MATIAQHTDLGSGMAVAMKDLEIRGAGNVLGGEQSGHIEGVGFDLYLRLVGEAVAALKGEAEGADHGRSRSASSFPSTPTFRTSGCRRRRSGCRRTSSIADAHDRAALAEVRAELVDRFGTLPEPVERLFDVAHLRVLVRTAGRHRGRRPGQQDPVLPGRAPRVGQSADRPAVPRHRRQASGPYDPCAETCDGAGGR